MKKILLVLMLLSIGVMPVFAQDYIYFRNKDVIDAKVLEVGPAVVKYRLHENEKGPVLSAYRTELVKIVYENGTIAYMNAGLSPFTPGIIKFGFFAPLGNYITLTYEQPVSPGNSIELTLGYIGAGNPESPINNYGDFKAQGGLIRAGWKIIFPTYLSRSPEDHPLHGAYFRPDILLGAYRQKYYTPDYFGQPVPKQDDVVYAALLLCIGKQWVVKDWLTLDIYAGAGYHFSTLFNTQPWNHGNSDYDVLTLDNRMALSGGLKLGIALK